MKNYEILFIVDGSITDEEKEKVVVSVKELIEKVGGVAEEADKWGMRKYAYPINYKNEGYYVLVNFTAEATLPSELERVMGISDAVMRHMIVKK